MKKLSILAFTMVSQFVNAQDYSVEFIKKFSKEAINNDVIISYVNNGLNCVSGANFYKVKYKTTNAQLDTVWASGLLALPDIDLKANTLPLLSDQHGTITNRIDAPSLATNDLYSSNSYTSAVAACFAGSGFVTCMPDYIGLGDSQLDQYFVHSQTESSSTIDLIKAVKKYCHTQSINLNGQLFLSGYSQGAHATLASTFSIEQNYPSWNIVAVSGQSGPYDLSKTMFNSILNNFYNPFPTFLPLTITGYQHAYENQYDSLSQVFIKPYDTLIANKLGNVSQIEIDNSLPRVNANSILQPKYLQSIQNDTMHVLRVALKQNNVFDLPIKSTMKLLYCNGDNVVSPNNSKTAAKYITKLGNQNVSSIRVDNDLFLLDHDYCLLNAYQYTKYWFLSLANVTAVSDLENNQFIRVNTDNRFIHIDSDVSLTGKIMITDASGLELFTQQITNQSSIDISLVGNSPSFILIKFDGNRPFYKKACIF
jgi:hypothetical protein